MILLGILCFAPLLHIFAVSFSSSASVAANEVTFWPRRFSTIAYRYAMSADLFWSGLYNSFVRTGLGVVMSLFFTVIVAYPLSKDSKRFRHRTLFAWFFFLPMIINGGLIPNYILIKELGLLDNILALVLPMALPVFYILVMLNFFRNLPGEMEESALMDGASQWRILFQIYVPLSLPAMATIAVYILAMHWNSWFDGLIYMNDPNNYPLMTYLHTAVLNTYSRYQVSSRTNNAAMMFLGATPIILTYPFLQRYFVKGLVLGGVKG